ncbi:MAG: DUF4157 domain-containing protein [Planctomycetota bacterium]
MPEKARARKLGDRTTESRVGCANRPAGLARGAVGQILTAQRALGNQALQRLCSNNDPGSSGPLDRARLQRFSRFVTGSPDHVRVTPSSGSPEQEAERKAHEFARIGLQDTSPKTAVPSAGAVGRLPKSIRSLAEPVYGRDLGGVRIHVDPAAASAANARAFTIGDNIVFNRGQYAPQTSEGLRLIGHELGHVAQQRRSSGSAAGTAVLQRRTYRGSDTGGTYTLDDDACELHYRPRWFFKFETSQTEAEQLAYMAAAKREIEDRWSDKMPLIPDSDECSCHPKGIRVLVDMSVGLGRRRGPGFSVTVSDRDVRAFANPVTQHVELDIDDDQLQDVGAGPVHPVPAHEFGHTIEITDEYNAWASLFGTQGSQDSPSIMHSGAQVRPRHYQHFADLVNLEFGGGCTYWPNGVRQPSYAQPVERWSGLPFGFLPPQPDFLIGLSYDRRVSNTPLLGLLYPQIGMTSIWNPQDNSALVGPTVGLSLSRVAYPLFLDIRTGALFDPENPASVPNVQVPMLVDVGVHTEGFRVGVNYTVATDLLGKGPWTHIVGVGLSVPMR